MRDISIYALYVFFIIFIVLYSIQNGNKSHVTVTTLITRLYFRVIHDMEKGTTRNEKYYYIKEYNSRSVRGAWCRCVDCLLYIPGDSGCC